MIYFPTLRSMFAVRSIDLDGFTFPPLEVRTWSSVFGSGGSITIEATDRGHRIEFNRVAVKTNSDAREARAEYAIFVENWNEEPRENWLKVISDALAEVDAYNADREKDRTEAVIKDAAQRAALAVLTAQSVTA